MVSGLGLGFLLKNPFLNENIIHCLKILYLVFLIHVRVYRLYENLCAKADVVMLFRIVTVRRSFCAGSSPWGIF